MKWGKELFSNVEVNTEEEPMLFKAQLFALTGVQPERQKVMLKGMTLKDDDWGNLKLKDVTIHKYILTLFLFSSYWEKLRKISD